MSELAKVFETNRIIVYSVYGQVFFLLGLAVLFQSRRHSRLALARSLWLLGAFGILHGISEWAYVFVPIQAGYLLGSVVRYLWLAHAIVEVLSFAFLFQFGVALICKPAEASRIKYVVVALLTLWAGLLFFYLDSKLLTGQPDRQLVATADAVGRYLLALPGGILAGIGLLREVKTVEALELPRIASYLRRAAFSFLAYAGLAGIVVPNGVDFFPASVLNYDLVWKTFGAPAPVFRSLCGLAITYFIVRAMQVFDVEMDRMIERMEHERTIAVERERIGRELHDGTIQSIYAAGLALEDVALTIGKDANLARQKVREVMALQNRTIDDIRKYIVGLNPVDDRPFEKQLRVLVDQFAGQAGLAAHVEVVGNEHQWLPASRAAQLLQVAREAFANVAKHAKAKRLSVLVRCAPETICLEIGDDGCGFDAAAVGCDRSRQGNGLRNIARRMETLGGSFRIDSSPGLGTTLSVIAPAEEVGNECCKSAVG